MKVYVLLTCDMIAVGSCASTGTIDVGGQIMELFAVLISHDGASCGPSISS